MRTVVLLTLITLTLHTATAQTEELPPLQNRTALFFTFSGLNLGGGLGGTHWFSDRTGVRLAMGYTSASNETDRRDPADLNKELETRDRTSFSVDCSLIKPFSRSTSITPYAGVAVGFEYSGENLTYVNFHRMTRSSSTRSFGMRLMGSIGAEVWLTRSISLSGEQSFGLRYSNGSDPLSVSEMKFGNSTSVLMVSVYVR
jgi:hypothetical protein